MSTPTETPPPVVEEAPAPRQCPRCGAAMTEEQEWCLRCGAAVGTRIATAQGWRCRSRSPAYWSSSRRSPWPSRSSSSPTTRTRSPAPRPRRRRRPPSRPRPPTPTPPHARPGRRRRRPARPRPRRRRPTSTPDNSSGSGTIAEWPAGQDGWTVVLASKNGEDAARDSAESFSAEGIPDVGILDSDDFSSLQGGFWVVYSGEFESQAEATRALDDIDAPDAYIRRITADCARRRAARERLVGQRVARHLDGGRHRGAPSTGMSAATDDASASRA